LNATSIEAKGKHKSGTGITWYPLEIKAIVTMRAG
jgi:hypothetical protein